MRAFCIRASKRAQQKTETKALVRFDFCSNAHWTPPHFLPPTLHRLRSYARLRTTRSDCSAFRVRLPDQHLLRFPETYCWRFEVALSRSQLPRLVHCFNPSLRTLRFAKSASRPLELYFSRDLALKESLVTGYALEGIQEYHRGPRTDVACLLPPQRIMEFCLALDGISQSMNSSLRSRVSLLS